MSKREASHIHKKALRARLGIPKGGAAQALPPSRPSKPSHDVCRGLLKSTGGMAVPMRGKKGGVVELTRREREGGKVRPVLP